MTRYLMHSQASYYITGTCTLRERKRDREKESVTHITKETLLGWQVLSVRGV